MSGQFIDEKIFSNVFYPLPVLVEAQEMKDSVKGPDYIERLAHKYMQKCTVESSTESESESIGEVGPRPLAGRLKKAKDSRGLQFLDPYDGDSEDSSTHSDCSLNSLSSIEVALQAKSAPKAMALEDAGTSEDGESFPKPPDWLCPEPKLSELHTVNDSKELLELPSQGKHYLGSLLQLEVPRVTEAFTSMQPRADHSLPMSLNTSASTVVLASPGDAAPQLILAADCDGPMAEEPLIKRKQGIPIPESASEKLRRKKFRAT